MSDKMTPRQLISAIAATKSGSMSDDLRRALDLLSQQLYGREVHFVLELIQNAEDNTYPVGCDDRFIEFTVHQDSVEVYNNEGGFTRANVESICSVGRSTKRERALGYVGEKGIGFKSVFRISARPQIISAGFSFEFDDHDYIVPHWCDPPPDIAARSGTTILLPLREIYRHGGDQPLADQIAEIDERLLLFLRKLTRIVVRDEMARRTVEYSRADLGKGRARLIAGKSESVWRLAHREIDVPTDLVESKREGVRRRELVVGFQLDAQGRCLPDHSSPVFAFLPTQVQPGFAFLVQGDFLLTADRGDIVRGNRWNEWLRNELGPTIVEAVRSGAADRAFAQSVLACVPLAQHLRGDYFQPVGHYVENHLPLEPVFLGESGKLHVAADVLRASATVRQLFPNSQLSKLLGRDVEYLHPDCIASDVILDALGVPRFGAADLQAILARSAWVGRQPPEWFVSLYGFLDEHEHLAGPEILQQMQIVLLEGGQLARPADGTIYLPAREERIEERYGLSRFRWRLVSHAIVRRDPSPTTAAARLQNERTQRARDFLVNKLGVQYHRPLEIAVDQILPYFEKRWRNAYSLNQLQDDFGLILYLKEQWGEIQDAAEKAEEAPALREIVRRTAQCVPVPLRRVGDGVVERVGNAYLPANFGGSLVLERLLQGVANVAFLSNEFVKWDPDRKKDDRKAEDWAKFLLAVGAHDRVRLVRSDDQGYSLPSPGEPVPDGARVIRFSGEWDAPEVDELLAKMAGASTESRLERAQELLRHLDDSWAEWEGRYGGEDWWQPTYVYKPTGPGRHQERAVLVPARFVRALRRAAWLPTQDGRCLQPHEVWLETGKVRESATRVGALLRGRIANPGLVRALGIQTDVAADAIISDLRRLVNEKRLDLGAFRQRFRHLAQLHGAGELTERDRSVLMRERLIYVPDREPPFANALEVVWRQPGGLVARGFPALEHHYPGLFELFAALDVPESITRIEALREISRASEEVFSDPTARLRLWESYQVLASSDGMDPDDEAGWTDVLREFRSKGRLACRYNRMRPVDQVYVPDAERVVALFGRKVDFLWLPEEAPISVSQRLASVLGLRSASSAEMSVEHIRGAAADDIVRRFDACRRPLIGYLNYEHQPDYQKLFREGRLGEFACAPLIPASALSVHYVLDKFEVTDTRNVHAMIHATGVYVLVSDGIDIDEVGISLQRDLGNVSAVAEVFAVLHGRSDRDRESYARRRRFEVTSADWQTIVDSYQQPVETPEEIATRPPEEDTGGAMPAADPGSDAAGEMSAGLDGEPAPRPPLDGGGDQATTRATAGIAFRGRTQLVSPRGSNQRLRERLEAAFPGRREAVVEYCNEQSQGDTLLEPGRDESGVVRRARTVLRAVNLEEGFLRFHPAAMQIFDAAGRPSEVLLTGDDEEEQSLAKIDYERAILHSGDDAGDRAGFRALLEREGLPPGAILELEPTNEMEVYHLHSVPLDEPLELTDVSWWDFDDEGVPATQTSAKVCFPFAIHEGIYRAERRWEQREAYAALVQGRNQGVLSDVYELLAERAKRGEDGMTAPEINRHLWAHDHPCGYSTVLGVLYGYECFAQDGAGRWTLQIGSEQSRRAGYDVNLGREGATTRGASALPTIDLDPPPPTLEQGEAGPSHREGSQPRSVVAAEAAQVSPNRGVLTLDQSDAVRRALEALRGEDSSECLAAARRLVEIFAELVARLEAALGAAVPSGPRAGTVPGGEAKRAPHLLRLVRECGDDAEASLAAALLAYQVAQREGDRRCEGEALKHIGLAMRDVKVLPWARACLREATRTFRQVVPKLSDSEKAARSSAREERERVVSAAQRGARKLLRAEDGPPLPELREVDWPAAVLLVLPRSS